MRTSSPQFRLPKLGELYSRQILQRCEELIESKIWEGIHIQRLRAWCGNFCTPIEKYFAARLLDNLIYRSNQQTFALMLQLFQRVLPQLFRDKGQGHQDFLADLTTKGADPGLRIVPVIKKDDPLSESAPEIVRFLKRYVNFSDRWIAGPDKIFNARKKGITRFLFVDDFLGTGKQFADFVQSWRLHSLFRNSFAVYAPLVAHTRGLSRLTKRFPSLNLTSVETLSDDHGLFSPQSHYFQDGINSAESARRYYVRLVRGKIEKDLMGFGGLQLAFGFEHGTPNGTLPIFWSKDRMKHLLVR